MGRMFVCSHCLQEIRSREGNVFACPDYDENKVVEEDGEEMQKCDWCEEMIPVGEMWEVR